MNKNGSENSILARGGKGNEWMKYNAHIHYLDAEGKGFVRPFVLASYTALEMSLPTAFITSTSSCLTADKKTD